tara:strand:+ start:11323 stop:11688 length:366 start_codon:yes stop_codon:yes gene_type:complete
MQTMYSVGTDIIEVERVKTLIDKYGDRFLNKIFTSNEITYCESHKNPSIHFAGRFSVKESIKKAASFNCDIDRMKFNQISIITDKNGRPYVDCKYFPLDNIDVSISHTQTHAISIAILNNA